MKASSFGWMQVLWWCYNTPFELVAAQNGRCHDMAILRTRKTLKIPSILWCSFAFGDIQIHLSSIAPNFWGEVIEHFSGHFSYFSRLKSAFHTSHGLPPKVESHLARTHPSEGNSRIALFPRLSPYALSRHSPKKPDQLSSIIVVLSSTCQVTF